MAENNDENAKKAKIQRRNGKAALTRKGKSIGPQIAGNRSAEEVKASLDLYEQIFSDLTWKHEQLTLLIEDDEQFEEEEKWFEEVQERFLRIKIDTQDYIKDKQKSQNRTLVNAAENVTNPITDETTPNAETN